MVRSASRLLLCNRKATLIYELNTTKGTVKSYLKNIIIAQPFKASSEVSKKQQTVLRNFKPSILYGHVIIKGVFLKYLMMKCNIYTDYYSMNTLTVRYPGFQRIFFSYRY